MFHVTAVEHEYGPVLLGESSVLASSCPELEKVGNLTKWLIEVVVILETLTLLKLLTLLFLLQGGKQFFSHFLKFPIYLRFLYFSLPNIPR